MSLAVAKTNTSLPFVSSMQDCTVTYSSASGCFSSPVGELVHVVQEHDGGRVLPSLLKGGLDLLDKVSVGLVFSGSGTPAGRFPL